MGSHILKQSTSREIATVLALLFFSWNAQSQPFRIENTSFGSGKLRMEFGANASNYYILERTESLTQGFVPAAMLLPASTIGIFEDKATQARVFYRMKSVPLSAPLDTDTDGMDDIYELRRQPNLSPLDPSDALTSSDANGLTHLQEYRAARFAQGKRRMAVGDHHILAVRDDGTLWAAGENRFGQLGDGTTNNIASLIPIEPNSRWKAVGAGGQRSFGIKVDGSLWCWGLNRSYAPLGDGGSTNLLTPTRIGQENDWIAVAASPQHTMALKQNATLWGWGGNTSGQIGDGSRTTRATPIPVETNNAWSDVDVGQNFSLLLRKDGRLFACGYNEWGQLGIGATNLSSEVLAPVAQDSSWRAIAAGDFHGLAIQSDNTLWAWGQLYEDAGGGLVTVTNRFAPTQIGTKSSWLGVGGGYQHSIAFDTDCALWAWGYNFLSGTVGDGTQRPRPNPIRIASSNTWLSAVARGGNHLGIRADATLWNWSGVNGQFTGDTGLFKAVMPDRRFRAVAAGNNHSIAVEESGQVWTWGDNGAGQLGDGSTQPGLPRQIATDFAASTVSAGGNHSLAIDEAGGLWMWGSVAFGQGSWGSPWPINFGFYVTNRLHSASSGGSHWISLDSQGSISAFGGTDHGQLPRNDFLTNAYSAVGAGGWSSFAIGLDGSIYMWGKFEPSSSIPTGGQLGTPGFAFKQVVGGAQHALAIRDDQTLWSMGINTWGQLGIGTNSYAGLMKPVMTNHTWKAIAAYYHNLAIREDGSLWFWGYDGSTHPITRSPIALSTNVSWKAVAAGYKHSLALQDDGSLWTWGNNEYGQLGVSPFSQMSSQPAWKPPPPQ